MYFGISDGGFIGSAIGGAIGGYVGSSGSSSPNASVQEPAPPVSDQNIAIIELCEAIYSSEVSYDLSCGKIKVRHGGQGCSRYTYEYVSVGHYVKSIYPNGTAYSITRTGGSLPAVTIIIQLPKGE